MELGFGNEIEEILYILGSRQDESVDKENPESYFSKYHRQNVLLSTTLKEKVNILVKINLENPIMIHLDYKKMQPMLSFKEFGSLGSNALCNEGKMKYALFECIYTYNTLQSIYLYNNALAGLWVITSFLIYVGILTYILTTH